MNRRSLLQMLTLAPLFSMQAPSLVRGPSADQVEYKGWTCVWDGWIKVPNQRCEIGRWVAVKDGLDWGFYSNYPGRSGWFIQDQMLDCSRSETQDLVTPEAKDEDRERYKRESFRDLCKAIDENKLPQYFRRS